MPRVLVVEDNPHIMELYRRLLFRYDPLCVDDAEKAFKALENDHFDLVVLDMHLPRVSGMEILKYLRSFPNHENLIIFAISSDDNLKYQAKDNGADFWMTKPIDVDELFKQINKRLSPE